MKVATTSTIAGQIQSNRYGNHVILVILKLDTHALSSPLAASRNFSAVYFSTKNSKLILIGETII